MADKCEIPFFIITELINYRSYNTETLVDYCQCKIMILKRGILLSRSYSLLTCSQKWKPKLLHHDRISKLVPRMDATMVYVPLACINGFNQEGQATENKAAASKITLRQPL